MWTVERQPIEPGFSERIVIAARDRALSFAEVIAGWRENAAFRDFYLAVLAATTFPAFFWETPPIRPECTGDPYEFMLIRSEALARMPPDADAFRLQFASAGSSESVASFFNLGGDALLVVPRQILAPEFYSHLAVFVRSAPPAQQHRLFQCLAAAIDEFLPAYDRRIWISTSGLGVAWLHIRLDSSPKYYQHRPYTQM